MPNNPDILDTGRIERDQDSTARNPKLEYKTDLRRDLKLGANVDGGTHDPKTEKALHDAIAANVGSRRNNNLNEALPSDPIELGTRGRKS